MVNFCESWANGTCAGVGGGAGGAGTSDEAVAEGHEGPRGDPGVEPAGRGCRYGVVDGNVAREHALMYRYCVHYTTLAPSLCSACSGKYSAPG